MKILIVLKNWENEEGVGESVRKIKQDLEKKGWTVDTISRENDLHINSLSGSMGSLKEIIREKDEKENYDLIYTQDWSIAFPILFPKRFFQEKHFCFFHGKQDGESSKIFQKIVGNMMGERLIVKNEELKKMFPKSTLVPSGIDENLFRQNKILP